MTSLRRIFLGLGSGRGLGAKHENYLFIYGVEVGVLGGVVVVVMGIA